MRKPRLVCDFKSDITAPGKAESNGCQQFILYRLRTETMTLGNTSQPDYGIDAPNVLRNLLVIGIVCLLLGFFGPRHIHVGQIDFLPRPMFLGTGTLLVLESLL